MFPDQPPQPIRNFEQPPFKRQLGARRNHAGRQQAVFHSIAFDHTVTGACRTAIDAEHAHVQASASNSFSSISKLEYTFCTSSCSSSASLSLNILPAFLPSSLIRFFGTMAMLASSE